MGCSTYLSLGWQYQPLAPGHLTLVNHLEQVCSLVTWRGEALAFIGV